MYPPLDVTGDGLLLFVCVWNQRLRVGILCVSTPYSYCYGSYEPPSPYSVRRCWHVNSVCYISLSFVCRSSISPVRRCNPWRRSLPHVQLAFARWISEQTVLAFSSTESAELQSGSGVNLMFRYLRRPTFPALIDVQGTLLFTWCVCYINIGISC